MMRNCLSQNQLEKWDEGIVRISNLSKRKTLTWLTAGIGREPKQVLFLPGRVLITQFNPPTFGDKPNLMILRAPLNPADVKMTVATQEGDCKSK